MYYTRNYYIYYTENIQNSLVYFLLFSSRELEVPPLAFILWRLRRNLVITKKSL